MAVLRGGSTQGSHVLVSNTNPYDSRLLEVETDGVATAAYLCKIAMTPDGQKARGETVAAAWVANHQAAPQDTDLGRLNAGLIPTMPVPYTKHPQGRPPLDPQALEVAWFEEGDGVAVLESGEPLCVIPSWSDMDRGVPGYSRDTMGQTPFALALDDELAHLGPRVQQAQAYWEWRANSNAWPGFQQAVLGHLLNRLGPGGYYWHDVGQASGASNALPLVGVSERPGDSARPFTVLSTVGMSCQRMPAVELYEDDVTQYSRIELAVATTLPSQLAGSVFPWLAQYPWRSATWFGPGHNVRWYHDPSTFPLGPGWAGVLLLDNPAELGAPAVPNLSGFTFGGDPVRWLWLIPITEDERQIAGTDGPEALVAHMARNGRTWIVGQ